MGTKQRSEEKTRTNGKPDEDMKTRRTENDVKMLHWNKEL